MLEYGGAALGGLILFGLGLAKVSPIRPGERSAEVMLALFSAVALLVILGPAFGLVVGGTDGGSARVAAFWFGAISGYLIYRMYRRRMPPAPAPTPWRPPPGHDAMNRRMSEVIRGIGADIRAGNLSPEKKQAYLKALQENDALLRQYRRGMPPRPEPAYLPPEYAALSREAEQTFQAMKDAVARGEEPSPQDALKLESYAMKMAEHDHAILQKTQRQGRIVRRVGLALAGLFLVYLVILFVNV